MVGETASRPPRSRDLAASGALVLEELLLVALLLPAGEELFEGHSKIMEVTLMRPIHGNL